MSRYTRFLPAWAIAAFGACALILLMACGGGGSHDSRGSAGGGSLNMFITDAPSDEWQEVSVVLKGISLRNAADHSWQGVWSPDAANPDSGKVNLVDLSGVAELLGTATIPVGTYDRVRLTIDTDPATMNLVDDSGNVYTGSSQIKVVDPSGKGEIPVSINPAITVAEGQTTNLQVDFDLAHPMSLVVQNGVVVMDLQLRHKPIHSIRALQFARHIGTVTAVTGTGFTIHTLRGSDFTYQVDANTWYWNADAKALGAFADLAVGKGVMVASNMNADGSLYARRVWYAADVSALPACTPEGLVRRVTYDPADGVYAFSMLHKDATTGRWRHVTVNVDSSTAWTFREGTAMGTGTAYLQYIWRGVRVDVVLADPLATRKVAKFVNIHSAHDEGMITATSSSDFTFGWHGWSSRTWSYSTVADHAFSWWFFGLPSGAAASVVNFQGAVSAAQQADLWVMGRADLVWDVALNGGAGGWAAESLVLAPEMLQHPTLTTGYDPSAGTIGVNYFTWDPDPRHATNNHTMTVSLDTTGDLQTVVESLVWDSGTRVLTFTVPVPVSEWATLLQPGNLTALRIWVRPQLNGDNATYSWHAYTVMAIKIQ